MFYLPDPILIIRAPLARDFLTIAWAEIRLSNVLWPAFLWSVVLCLELTWPYTQKHFLELSLNGISGGALAVFTLKKIKIDYLAMGMYTLLRLIFHNIGLHLANTLSPRASRIRESWNDGGTGIWTGHLRYKPAVENLQNLAMILTNSTLFRPSFMQMSLAVFSIAWWRCDRRNDCTSIQFSNFSRCFCLKI